MKAVITRPMRVLGDEGTLQTFVPSTKDIPFVEIGDATYRRLSRAGAAKLFRATSEDLKVDDQQEHNQLSNDKTSGNSEQKSKSLDNEAQVTDTASGGKTKGRDAK